MFQRITNIILLIFLMAFSLYAAGELYYLDKEYFLCPVEYQQDTIIIRHDSYGQGDFLARRGNGRRRHNGIDLQAPIGAAVYAVRGAKVREARFNRGMGNYIELLHPGGLVSVYGHLSKIEVKENQRVRQGDKIGEAGKTGNANYNGVIPHLHFELWHNGELANPMDFLE